MMPESTPPQQQSIGCLIDFAIAKNVPFPEIFDFLDYQSNSILIHNDPNNIRKFLVSLLDVEQLSGLAKILKLNTKPYFTIDSLQKNKIMLELLQCILNQKESIHPKRLINLTLAYPEIFQFFMKINFEPGCQVVRKLQSELPNDRIKLLQSPWADIKRQHLIQVFCSVMQMDLIIPQLLYSLQFDGIDKIVIKSDKRLIFILKDKQLYEKQQIYKYFYDESELVQLLLEKLIQNAHLIKTELIPLLEQENMKQIYSQSELNVFTPNINESLLKLRALTKQSQKTTSKKVNDLPSIAQLQMQFQFQKQQQQQQQHLQQQQQQQEQIVQQKQQQQQYQKQYQQQQQQQQKLKLLQELEQEQQKKQNQLQESEQQHKQQQKSQQPLQQEQKQIQSHQQQQQQQKQYQLQNFQIEQKEQQEKTQQLQYEQQQLNKIAAKLFENKGNLKNQLQYMYLLFIANYKVAAPEILPFLIIKRSEEYSFGVDFKTRLFHSFQNHKFLQKINGELKLYTIFKGEAADENGEYSKFIQEKYEQVEKIGEDLLILKLLQNVQIQSQYDQVIIDVLRAQLKSIQMQKILQRLLKCLKSFKIKEDSIFCQSYNILFDLLNKCETGIVTYTLIDQDQVLKPNIEDDNDCQIKGFRIQRIVRVFLFAMIEYKTVFPELIAHLGFRVYCKQYTLELNKTPSLINFIEGNTIVQKFLNKVINKGKQEIFFTQINLEDIYNNLIYKHQDNSAKGEQKALVALLELIFEQKGMYKSELVNIFRDPKVKYIMNDLQQTANSQVGQQLQIACTLMVLLNQYAMQQQ